MHGHRFAGHAQAMTELLQLLTPEGERRHDPVVLVSFDPESEPGERVTLRYEYRPALVALGVLPRHAPVRDRLAERDRAHDGFAPPPAW